MRMQYPSEWSIVEYDNEDLGIQSSFIQGLRLYNESDGDFGITIELRPILDLAVQNLTEFIVNSNLPDFELISSGPAFINENYLAQMAEYLYSNPQGTQLRVIEFWTELGDGIYIIRFTTNLANYPLYLQDLRRTLDSLELNELPLVSSPTSNVEDDDYDSTSNTEVLETYENETFGIRMQYPEDWTKIENKTQPTSCRSGVCIDYNVLSVFLYSPIRFSESDADYGSLNVNVVESPDIITHEQWLSTLPTRIENLQNEGLEVVKSSSTTIGNRTAEELEIFDPINGSNMTEITTTIGDRRYEISYQFSGLQSHSTIEEIIDSLQLLQIPKDREVTGLSGILN